MSQITAISAQDRPTVYLYDITDDVALEGMSAGTYFSLDNPYSGDRGQQIFLSGPYETRGKALDAADQSIDNRVEELAAADEGVAFIDTDEDSEPTGVEQFIDVSDEEVGFITEGQAEIHPFDEDLVGVVPLCHDEPATAEIVQLEKAA